MFSKAECQWLVGEIERFEEPRWFQRHKINSLPVDNDGKCEYGFCGYMQMPSLFRLQFMQMAPSIEGVTLQEGLVNRYRPGEFMPLHRDHGFPRYNLVINLTAHPGDGLMADGEFVPDEVGRGLLFPARSIPHAVPPVKGATRYVAIFLYA